MTSVITETDDTGTTDYSWTGPTASLLSLSISGDTAGARTIDFANADPLPGAGISLDSPQVNVATDGTATLSTLATTATAAMYSDSTADDAEIRYPATTSISYLNAGTNDYILPIVGTTILAGTPPAAGTHGPDALVNTGATLLMSGSQQFTLLSISRGGTARMEQDGTAVLQTQALEMQGPNTANHIAGSVLDLADNDLIDSNPGDYASIAQYLQAGYANGAWTGETASGLTPASIISSVAAADPTQTEALGYAQIGSLTTIGQLDLSSFDGVSVASGDVVVAFTLYGDANLDGVVNSDDFDILAANLGSSLTGWSNGDFNYDGSIDSSDQSLLLGNLQLAAPADLNATAVSPNEIDLSWVNQAADATQVSIYASINGTDFFPFDVVDSSLSTYAATGLSPDMAYTFEVVATNTTLAISPPSNTAPATTDVDPWDLQATGASTVDEGAGYQLNVSINPAASAPVFGYITVDWGDGTPVDTYTLAQLPPPPYVFATGINSTIIDVTAFTDSGAAVPYSVTANPVGVDLIPSAPTNLQTSIISPTEVDLNWTDTSQDADGYLVLQSLNGAAFQQIADVGGTDSSYDDTSLSPADTADYEVEAAGDSALIVSAPASAPAVITPLTAAPAGMPTLTVAQSGANAAVVTWSYAGTDDLGFELEEEDVAAGTNFQLISTPGAVGASGAGTLTVTGLDAGDEYEFRMRADHVGRTASRYTLPASIQLGLAAGPSLSVYNTDLSSPTLTKSGPDVRVGWVGLASDATVELEVQGDAYAGNTWHPVTFGNDTVFGAWGSQQFGSDYSVGGQDYSGDADPGLEGYINDPEVKGPGTYIYRIRSVNAQGVASAWSQPQSAVYSAQAIIGPPLAVSATDTSITAAWTVPDSNGSRLDEYLFIEPVGQPATVNAWDFPQQAYSYHGGGFPDDGAVTKAFSVELNGFVPGTQYNLCLWSVFEDSLSYNETSIEFSKATITTTGGDATPPAAPDKVWAVNLGDGVYINNVEIIWHNSSGNEDGYVIQQSSEPDFSGDIRQFKVGTDVSTYIDTQPALPVHTYYRVAAYKGSAQSPWTSVADLLPRSPQALAISWFPIDTPNLDLEAMFLQALYNNPPPESFLTPAGGFDLQAFQNWVVKGDFRDVLELRVGYSVDPYTGALSVTPYALQTGGYTPIVALGILVAGDAETLPIGIAYNADKTQEKVILKARFRLSAKEQPGAAFFNLVSGHGGFHRAAWVWAEIDYTVDVTGAVQISFSGSSVPNQNDYIDGVGSGSYDVINNSAGFNAFLAAPYGALGPRDNR